MKPQPRYQPGDRIGDRYQVHQALMGGMGEVYLCLDLEEMIPLALKTFQQRYLTNAQRLRRAFEQEVVTWVALEKHPNIVRCFWMQMLDNQPFMALEWIAGEEGKGTDLRSWLHRGPLDIKLTLDIALDICHGLIHAQQKQPGLVHRDLKPENILIAQGGLAKITDFGLAQIVQEAYLKLEDAPLTSNGHQSLVGGGGIAGTPAYMAPEQWRGEPLDECTDIYALGCILYEMFTGMCPYTIDFTPSVPRQMQTWLHSMQAAHETLPVPLLPAAFSPSLRDLVSRCLAKSPSDRPTDLRVFVGELTKLYLSFFNKPPVERTNQENFTANDYKLRGITYKHLQLHEQALADFDRAINLVPNFADFYFTRAIAWYDLQRYEEALVDYGRAIELDPSFVKAYTNRGNTYHVLKNYEKALADYESALAFDCNYTKVYFNRGNTYHALQDYEAALVDFNQVINLDPGYTQAYVNRGSIYSDLQHWEQALADFRYAIELDPDAAEAYFKIANIYTDLQQHQQALVNYEQALTLNPNNAVVYFNRANTYRKLQQYNLALLDYSRAIDCGYKAYEAYTNRGNVYEELEQYEIALEDYNLAIKLNPRASKAYVGRGNIFRALKQYQVALENYHSAIEFDPNYTLAFCNRGVTHCSLQQYNQALKDFQRVIELDTDYADAYYNIGVILVQCNKLDEALVFLDEAKRLGQPMGESASVQVRQMLNLPSIS